MEQTTVNWSDCLEYAKVSDIGMRRANNQDACVVMLASDLTHWQRRGHCFTVADGMGAHAAGELASKLAVDNVPHAYHKLLDLPPAAALREAVVEANQLIHKRGCETPGFQGMGTTCSTLVLLPAGAMVAHVGDSRIYRLRGDKLEQLTFDHSLVWEMAAATKRPGLALPNSVPKNVITRSLGPQPTVRVDLEGPFPVEVGDTYLLCSDGLTGPVTDEEIGAILSCLSIHDAAQTLVDLANLRGGPDNITVIGVHVTGPPVACGETSEAVMGPEEAATGRNVSPVFPAAIVLCLLGALVLGAAGEPWGAAISFLIAVIAGAAAIVQRLGGRAAGDSVPKGMLGRGPYRVYASQPTKELADSLAKMAQELREAAERKTWKLDWQPIDAHLEQAEAASGQQDYTRAVAQYSHGLRNILSQCRNDLRPPDDSSVLG